MTETDSMVRRELVLDADDVARGNTRIVADKQRAAIAFNVRVFASHWRISSPILYTRIRSALEEGRLR